MVALVARGECEDSIHHTLMVLRYGGDTASVTIFFLINLFLCRERSSV